jgi:hypothetical protein
MEGVSLFASRDASKSRLVLVLVNRDQTLKVTSTIALPGCGAVASSRLFSYSADSKGLTERPSEGAANALVVELEPFSFAVLEVKLKNDAP